MNAMQKEKQGGQDRESKLKAQTSLEYILIIAAGLILIVIIVYVVNSGVLNPNIQTGKDLTGTLQASIDALKP